MKICSNCVMDISDSRISFDKNGVCDHCLLFLNRDAQRWADIAKGNYEDILIRTIESLKKNRTSDYDCIVGVSGGCDSSFMLHKLVTEYGLQPLCLHVDAGWNTHAAVTNIKKLVSKLNLDLNVVVIDWNEVRELQLAFLKSHVSQQDTPQDHAFFSTLYNQAAELGIKTVLSGANLSTEAVQVPLEWIYYPSDIRQLNDIENKFCGRKLVLYPKTSVFQKKIIFPYIRRIRELKPLNMLNYNKRDAESVLSLTYGFQNFPEKHYESVFTKYYEAVYLPSKFGFDTRKVTYSSLILTGQITRNNALERLSKPSLSDDEAEKLETFVADKLQISLDELISFRLTAGKSHRDYKNQEFFYAIGSSIAKLFSTFDSSGAKR